MSDKLLVLEAQSGVGLAFGELVQRQQQGLVRFLLKFTRDLEFTEDIVQDTFVKAYVKLNTFKGESSFKTWLYRIGENTAKNKLKNQRFSQVHFNIESFNFFQDLDLDNLIYYSNIKRRIKKNIELLPKKQKEAVHLRVFEDLSFKEIARLMKTPYDTAKANYRHGLIKLRSQVLQDEIYEDWR